MSTLKKVSIWIIAILFVGSWGYISFCVTSIYEEATRGLAYLLAFPLVVAGLYLAYERTQSLKKQNKTDDDRLLAETFAKSIELLGKDSEAVRQGAIYALGKIAETNPSELIVIVNTLCAFIRHNQKRSEGEVCDKSRGKEENTGESKDEKEDNILNIDIEAAVATIRELSKKEHFEFEKDSNRKKYDLSNIYLPYADFSRARLIDFNLSDSCFYDCVFENTDFSNSNLVGSIFHESDFQNAVFNENTEIMKSDFSKTENLDKCKGIEKARKDKTILPDYLNIET